MRIRSTVPAIVAAAALLLPACSGSSEGSAAGSTTSATTAKKTTTTTEVSVPKDAVPTDAVEMQDLAFSPKVVVIEAGNSVTFTNSDAAAHAATADDGEWDTGAVGPGDSLLVGFPTAGTYRYRCKYHDTVTGTIVVTA